MIFKSGSCFSGVLGCPGLAVLGQLVVDGTMLPWFVLAMILCLPFAICFSLVFAGVAVSDCGLSAMQASVSALLGDLFSLCTQVCRHSCETCSLVVVFGYVALWP